MKYNATMPEIEQDDSIKKLLNYISEIKDETEAMVSVLQKQITKIKYPDKEQSQ